MTTMMENNEDESSSAAVDDILGGLFEEFSDSILKIDEAPTNNSTAITDSPTKKKKKKKKKKVVGEASSSSSPKTKSKKKTKKKKKKKPKSGEQHQQYEEEEEEEERIAGLSARDIEDILMQKIQFRKVLNEEQRLQEERDSKKTSFFGKLLGGKTNVESLEDEKQRKLDALLKDVKDPELRNEIVGQSQTLDQPGSSRSSGSGGIGLFKRILPESLDDVKERRLRELRQHMTDPELKEELVAQSHQIMLKADRKQEMEELGIISDKDVIDLIDPQLLEDEKRKIKEKLQQDEVRQQMEEQLNIMDSDFDDDDLYQWQLSVLGQHNDSDSDDDDDDNNKMKKKNNNDQKIDTTKSGSLLQKLLQKVSTAPGKAVVSSDDDSDSSDDSDDDKQQQHSQKEIMKKGETLEEEMERKKLALQLYLKAVDPNLENLAISNSNTQDLLLLQYKMSTKLEEIEENPTKFGFDGHRLNALKSALAERPLLKKMTTSSTKKKKVTPLSMGI